MESDLVSFSFTVERESQRISTRIYKIFYKSMVIIFLLIIIITLAIQVFSNDGSKSIEVTVTSPTIQGSTTVETSSFPTLSSTKDPWATILPPLN